LAEWLCDPAAKATELYGWDSSCDGQSVPPIAPAGSEWLARSTTRRSHRACSMPCSLKLCQRLRYSRLYSSSENRCCHGRARDTAGPGRRVKVNAEIATPTATEITVRTDGTLLHRRLQLAQRQIQRRAARALHRSA
jgi:hypothetical protein